MNTIEPREIVVYIHGVSPDVHGRSHAGEYQRMNDGIRRHNPVWPETFLGIEWGWNSSGNAPHDQNLLSAAQRELGGRVFQALDHDGDFSINPGRMILNNLRPLMFYGFGDIFYYVSADGKRAVRKSIAQQLCGFIDAEAGWDQPISITLIGHSAGSVIAFDLAFFLFFSGENEDHAFLPCDHCAYADARRIRKLADVKKLRIRRLITFGAPITMLAFRSDPVLQFFAGGNSMEPGDYGLHSNTIGASPLPGARWLNIWDKDDPIAWPVEPLMQSNGSGDGNDNEPSPVQDIYVDVSDSISRSHSQYWGSERVYKTIAGRW